MSNVILQSMQFLYTTVGYFNCIEVQLLFYNLLYIYYGQVSALSMAELMYLLIISLSQRIFKR